MKTKTSYMTMTTKTMTMTKMMTTTTMKTLTMTMMTKTKMTRTKWFKVKQQNGTKCIARLGNKMSASLCVENIFVI